MKDSPYHKALANMTAAEEVAEIVRHLVDVLRPTTPEVRKGVLDAIKKGYLDEIELE